MDIEVVDADGHVFEDFADMSSFFAGPLAGRITSQRPFPNDHLHIGTGSLFRSLSTDGRPGVQGTPDEWLRFLDGAGIGQAVLYPSGGLFHGMTVDVDISIAVARAYNDCFPICHALAVRRDLIDAHPGIPASLIGAFQAARRMAFQAMRMEAAVVSSPWIDEVIEDQRAALGRRLYANGLAANRPPVERLLRYLREQGLVSRELTPEDVFAQES